MGVRVPPPPRMESKGYVYILRSEVTGKIYIGSTRNLEHRFKAHNSGKVRSTKSGRPYILIHCEEYPDYSSARKSENYLKSGLGRLWIKESIIRPDP